MSIYSSLQPFILHYGLLAVFIIITLESAGLPLPGDTVIILGAICASTTGDLKIVELILVAATAAILGDNIGFIVGRRFGLPLVLRFGPKIGLNERRIRIGQALFDRHGAKLIFIARFVAILRLFTPVLAGVNRYSWRSFMIYNAVGGIVWATLYGMGAYLFGDAVQRIAGPLAMAGLGVVFVGLFLSWRVVRNYERRFEENALAVEANR
jgi:membrane protein DedA with SNARE-associated domain